MYDACYYVINHVICLGVISSIQFPSNEKNLHILLSFSYSSKVFAVPESLIASLSPFLPTDVYARSGPVAVSVIVYNQKRDQSPPPPAGPFRPYTNSTAATKNTWTKGMDTRFPHFRGSLSHAHLSYVNQARCMYTI